MKDHVDEVQLLELLEINADELVERFDDLIEDNYEWLCDQLGLEGWAEEESNE